MVPDAETGSCLRGESRGTASALQLPLGDEAAAGGYLAWRWKVDGPVPGADLNRREGDDSPARVTVAFRVPADASFRERARHRLARMRFGDDAPAAAITYLWGGTEAAGSILPSPYSQRVALVVLRNQGDPPGHWLSEARDIREDYRSFFGGEPPPIAGIALMTDSDDTGSHSGACFGDLLLLAEEGAG